MTDKEYEKLKQTLKEEEARRETLNKLEKELVEFSKTRQELEVVGMVGLDVNLQFTGLRTGYFSFRLTDYNLVKSFLDNYEDVLKLKIKQQRRILEK